MRHERTIQNKANNLKVLTGDNFISTPKGCLTRVQRRTSRPIRVPYTATELREVKRIGSGIAWKVWTLRASLIIRARFCFRRSIIVHVVKVDRLCVCGRHRRYVCSVVADTRRRVLRCRCPIIKSPPRKVFPGRQFTGKKPPHPEAARTGRIFSVNCPPGGDFIWGRFDNGDTFL